MLLIHKFRRRDFQIATIDPHQGHLRNESHRIELLKGVSTQEQAATTELEQCLSIYSGSGLGRSCREKRPDAVSDRPRL